jgi:hypothetical protein
VSTISVLQSTLTCLRAGYPFPVLMVSTRRTKRQARLIMGLISNCRMGYVPYAIGGHATSAQARLCAA